MKAPVGLLSDRTVLRVVLFVLLALCGMMWYTQLNKSNSGE